MTPEEILSWEPFLKRIPLFTGLSFGEISRIAGRMILLSLPKGATLYSHGEEGDAMYIVASGQVRLLVPQQGREAVAAVLGRGEVLGEIGLLTGERRTVTVLLDTTCEFLKLLRKDFEEVLRENSSMLLHLSRMLSRRLVGTNQTLAKVQNQPHLIAFGAALEREDRQILFLNLAWKLQENSRRRILIVDLSPEAGSLTRLLGLGESQVTEEGLRQSNLRDPASLNGLIQKHSSGLEFLNIPSAVLGGRLFGMIFLFINFLRESHDLVVINFGGGIGDVEKSVLGEVDRLVVAGCDALRPQFRQLQSELAALVDPKRTTQVWLGDFDPESVVFTYGAQTMQIPWSSAYASEFGLSGSASKALEGQTRALHAVERLARSLAGIKVGLALGSGAALGHSMIGILKAFKREKIPIDMIAGTSMGAAVAGLIALGMEPEEIEEVASKIDKPWVYENLFWDMTLPRSGLFSGQTLLRFLRSYFGSREFSDLELPFACVATDIETGEEVVLREGRVAEAIRASCGLPLIFKPIRLNGRYLVDGGLVNPVPTKVIADMGADILIAVSLAVPAGLRKIQRQPTAGSFSLPSNMETLRNMALPEVLNAPNLIEVFFQMIYTMEYEISQSRTSPAHVVINPDLAGFAWTEFHRAKDLIQLGERIAEAYIPQIKAHIPASK